MVWNSRVLSHEFLLLVVKIKIWKVRYDILQTDAEKKRNVAMLDLLKRIYCGSNCTDIVNYN